MEKLIEFYEMVSLNQAALRENERAAILKARRALNMFEQAMESFKTASFRTASFRTSTPEPLTVRDSRFLIAA